MYRQQFNSMVATAPTVYGIETECDFESLIFCFVHVATAPTVYGIETIEFDDIAFNQGCNSTYRLRY